MSNKPYVEDAPKDAPVSDELIMRALTDAGGDVEQAQAALLAMGERDPNFSIAAWFADKYRSDPQFRAWQNHRLKDNETPALKRWLNNLDAEEGAKD